MKAVEWGGVNVLLKSYAQRQVCCPEWLFKEVQLIVQTASLKPGLMKPEVRIPFKKSLRNKRFTT
jgi:hypothetical protein